MAGAESAQCGPGRPIPSWQGGRLNHSRTETLCPSQFTRTVFRASMSSFHPQSCPELSGLSASFGAWRRRRAPAPEWSGPTSPPVVGVMATLRGHHHYFKYCKISALALLKMVMHARSGGNLEVMGLMLGKVDGETMIIMDSFALPVEGTETRVNAQAAAYEYMAAYIENAKQVGRLENAIGWYHSHPGYGCWLSGIDVSTQMLNQQFQEPFVAVVIDPTRTISAGKVNLGAFRTYPKGYKPPDEGPSEYQTIPLNKIEDFGVHCKQYYALEVSYFKSSLDRKLLELLWNKYWVNTLSSSSLLTNADYTTGQVFDLSEKLEQSEAQLGRGSFMLGLETHDRKSEDKLAKATRDSCKTTIEAIHGLMSQVIKDKLFNQINVA
ncbi:LOW QUALITY PROTEIN: COP9 signalosome complex subunit 5 [Alexandromys fortis]|uniref:LOW QUALITY PROTEIN: COP9 signalosome complex subunit 5 n=1 Tax=Alexandromys fortis TaxID=100897 RepID=UPI002152ADC3|nr:LOW QUALITY PROTEIN: COP9 signalosome complex subunit 5 [Microtus fortis]